MEYLKILDELLLSDTVFDEVIRLGSEGEERAGN